MVPKYLPKKKKSYCDTKLQLAIHALKDGGKKLTVTETFGVPRSTLKEKWASTIRPCMRKKNKVTRISTGEIEIKGDAMMKN